MDLHAVMARLAAARPIFHSEADFQHALAWQLRHDCPQYSIRLEYRPSALAERNYVDIWAMSDAENVAIELKYKTRAINVTVNAERFALLNQSAQNLGRYDTLKDVQRVETIVAAVPHSSGFILLLTNDSSYWTPSRTPDAVDALFRMHERRTITGKLEWGSGASAGTRKAREAGLSITGTYPLTWLDYSTVADTAYGKLRYVLVKIAAHR